MFMFLYFYLYLLIGVFRKFWYHAVVIAKSWVEQIDINKYLSLMWSHCLKSLPFFKVDTGSAFKRFAYIIRMLCYLSPLLYSMLLLEDCSKIFFF